MGIWKSVEVDVDIEVEDVIDFIESASNKEIEEIKDAIKEFKIDSNVRYNSLYATQMYEDLIAVMHDAIDRHVDMRIMIKIISELK